MNRLRIGGRSRALFILMILLMAFAVSGCAGKNAGDKNPGTTNVPTKEPQIIVLPNGDPSPENDKNTTVTPTVKPTATPTVKATATPTTKPTATPTTSSKKDDKKARTIVSNIESGFYTSTQKIELSTGEASVIYYTTNCKAPSTNSTKYTGGIMATTKTGESPKATIIRARAYFEDGTESEEFVGTYFVGAGMDKRFSTLVFSIVGNPADLTESPNGIFYGKNAEKRGDDTERPVYVEAWEIGGENVISQHAGLRIYGGASRQNSLKSVKLFARDSYEGSKKNFKYDFFETPKLDGSDKTVSKYKKLVLRDAGNDFQFGFIRDEFNQRSAMAAGFEDYEAVRPAVFYLNGSYYGLFWLHESYCDNYFKNKYGDEGRDGEFEILEGGDTFKNVDWDENASKFIIEEYNGEYERFSKMDLSVQSNYDRLNEWMDVENYLDYFAFNIYIGNADWPHNNYKCYRYFNGTDEYAEDGPYDGRWRYLLHDTDYCMLIYSDQNVVKPDYDTLKTVLNKNEKKYSPLLAAILKNDHAKEYFVNKILSLMYGVYSEKNALELLNLMSEERAGEIDHFYNYLDTLKKDSSKGIWTSKGVLDDSLSKMKEFIRKRPAKMLTSLTSNLKLEKYVWINVSAPAGVNIGIDGAKVGSGFRGTFFSNITIYVSAPDDVNFDHWEINGEKYYDRDISFVAKEKFPNSDNINVKLITR